MDTQYDSYIHFVNPFARSTIPSTASAIDPNAAPTQLTSGGVPVSGLMHDASSDLNLSMHHAAHASHFPQPFAYEVGNAPNDPVQHPNSIDPASNNMMTAPDSNNNNNNDNNNNDNNNNNKANNVPPSIASHPMHPQLTAFPHPHMIGHPHYAMSDLSALGHMSAHLGPLMLDDLAGHYGAMRRHRDASELQLVLIYFFLLRFAIVCLLPIVLVSLFSLVRRWSKSPI
jgi:hypothetical protein